MGEIRDLADTLLIYGPFAILAVFFAMALWVTRASLKLPPEHKHRQRFAFALSGALWVVSVALAVVVTTKWPPTIVYQGSMGIHAESTKFYPVSNAIFVNSELHQPVDQGRWQWRYVVISSQFADGIDSVGFTHVFGDDLNTDFRDYRIRLSDLKAHRRLDFYADPNNPEVLLVERDGERAPYQVFAQATGEGGSADGGWFTAFAQESVPPEQLIRWLSSPDPGLRAHAREQVRRMSRREAETLLDHPELTEDAAVQIRAILDHG